MATFLISFVIIAASVAGLAVGAMMRRRPLEAACGGCGDGVACGCGRGEPAEPAP